jgi:hypothetical protein
VLPVMSVGDSKESGKYDDNDDHGNEMRQQL